MPINFPNSPSLNQLYNYDNKTWEWNGVYWEVYSALTSYITSAYTVGNGVSDISGVTGGNIALKSFSGININIIDNGNKLTFSGQSTSGLTSGSGTPDTLPKWVSSNSLGDSIVSDNGSTMTVNGDAEINNNYLGSRGGDVTFLFYGYRAGEGIDVSSYSSNLGIGNAVLKNSTGNNNIVIGEGLSEHPTESNISIGFGSYTINTSGQKNVIIGHESFKNNDSGSENISIGYGTLSNNNTGDSNIAIGSNSLNVNLSGDYNIAIGQSLASLESGRRNIAIGEFASRQLFDTDDNISIGIQSLYSNDRGSYNVAIGNFSLLSDTRGGSNVSIGYQSGYSLDGGSGNVFIGFRSAYEFNGGSRLYIHNDSGIPLLYGEFDNRRLGVNITAATNTLHVSGSTNPVRFEGLQFSSNTRYLVANEQGVVTFVTGVTGEKSFNLIAINGVTQLSATTLQRINFSGININITSAATNTLVFSSKTETQFFRNQSTAFTIAPGTRFFVMTNTSNAATEPVTQLYVEAPMTLKRLFFKTTNTQPASGSLVLTLRKNGADTALAITVTASTLANTFIATADVTLVEGDLINYRLVNNAAATSANITQISVAYEI